MVANGNNRFKPTIVKDAIRQILQERLHEKQYSSDQATIWSKEISNAITQRLKGCSKQVQTCLKFIQFFIN